MNLTREYPHLEFKKIWNLNRRSLIALGQCISLIKAITNTPILPEFYEELMKISLIKGAHSTTAIEGNTLTEDEIVKITEGEDLPQSREYLQVEVTNILGAFNELLKETVYDGKLQLITPEFLKRIHLMVGKNLGDAFKAIPGRFRENNVIVGTYRCPDSKDVQPLIEKYCQWLREEFKFESNNQQFSDVIIQAIVAHVYLEWIHPFGDGNGRTGRLLEFYILSRGGNPDIALHILSNHYNQTRSMYYNKLDKAAKTRELTDFIEYALIGFRDGLQSTLEKIQSCQLLITWHKYIYDQFDGVEIKKRDVFKRRRTLALEFPINKRLNINEIPYHSIKLAQMYSGLSAKTLKRDISELIDYKILIEKGGICEANINVINKMTAKSKESN